MSTGHTVGFLPEASTVSKPGKINGPMGMQTRSVTITSVVGRDIAGRVRKVSWSENLGSTLKDKKVAKGPHH